MPTNLKINNLLKQKKEWYKMKDYKDIGIELNQIVKHENLTNNEVSYFEVQKREVGYLWLMKYNSKGNTEEYNFDNIKIDSGVELINDDKSRWIVLGTKEEIYDKIFG